MPSKKKRNLTAQDILNMPDAPIGERFCDRSGELQRQLVDFSKILPDWSEVTTPGIRAIEAARTTDPELSELDRQVLDVIGSAPEGKGLSGKEIVKRLDQRGVVTSLASLQNHSLKRLKGLKLIRNSRRVGYTLTNVKPT